MTEKTFEEMDIPFPKEKTQNQYWYFRFHENFFDSMPLMKMQTEPGGYEFVVILLKLYCLSVRTGGMLECPTTDDGQIDIATLSEMLRHKPNIVAHAIQYFIKHQFLHLMEVVDNEDLTIFLPDVQNMTGKASKEADRKRAERNAKSALPVPEIKRNLTEERKQNAKAYGQFRNVYLYPEEADAFRNKYENATQLIERLSVYKAREAKDYPNDHAALEGFAATSGILNVSERDKRKKIYERYKKEALMGYPPPQEIQNDLTKMQYEELLKIAEENEEKYFTR